jgi:uncharacterized LabA/DUF88 family protein
MFKQGESAMSLTCQRVAILIDEVNIFLTARELYKGMKPNIKAILDKLNDREIVRVISYCVETPNNNVEFFSQRVKPLGIEVKSKSIQIFDNGQTKGDWDIDIALDAVQLSNKVDVITLITGDGDFVPLVHYLKSQGVKVELMAFHQKVSQELVKSVDEFIPIASDLLTKWSKQ